jgi:hypothetical protein
MFKIAFGIFIAHAALIGSTPAQEFPAPVGHRQPTAADVPSNDSVRGLGPNDAEPSGKRKGRWYNDANVPSICSNCNQ